MILNTNLDIRFCVYILLYQAGIGTISTNGISGIIGTSSVWLVQALVSVLMVLAIILALDIPKSKTKSGNMLSGIDILQ